ncbi:DUF1338 domain-containing protein [Marinilabiliaceae bacterium JC017]|nr:DUF1338 domain-containing protein [Marinilabiliaceae bacterium JC017]
MNNLEQLISQLFSDYQALNPSVKKIHQLFQNQSEQIINDHIAFRTIDFPEINIHCIARPFTERGYKIKGNYRFEEKKLDAIHLEHPNTSLFPRIFISQLRHAEFSKELQQVLRDLYAKIIQQKPTDDKLLMAGNPWITPSYNIYKNLLHESEYAAWFYVFGFRANHFTISVNHLINFNSLEGLNTFLKKNGFSLNSSGGEIKGSPQLLLEQSSILADLIEMEFLDGPQYLPACYYEFAMRYKDQDGKIFNGFIPQSANKIFESTNFRNK